MYAGQAFASFFCHPERSEGSALNVECRLGLIQGEMLPVEPFRPFEAGASVAAEILPFEDQGGRFAQNNRGVERQRGE